MGRQTKIEIAGRFKPFSHEAGAQGLIPFTDWVVTAFPTRLEISDLFGDTIVVELDVRGDVVDFTLEQDLEKGIARIFGKGREGYFEFHLFVDREEKSLAIKYARGAGIVLFVDGKKVELVQGEVIDLIDAEVDRTLFEKRERVSLGCHKKQDVSLIWKRCDLVEMLPILYFLSQSVILPSDEKISDLPSTEDEFLSFVRTGFHSLFVPKRRDEKYLGLPVEPLSKSVTPLYRLKGFQKAFRSLFIKESKGKVHLLPNLPKGFSSGRFVGAKIKGGKIDFEWRKNKLHSVIIHPSVDGEVEFVWPKGIKSLRIEKGGRSKGAVNKFALVEGNKTVVDKFQR